MGIVKKFIRKSTRPLRARLHGVEGEWRVKSELSPSIFDSRPQRQIHNLILSDGNNHSHEIDHILIRENGIFCIETKNLLGLVFGNEKTEKWLRALKNGEKQYIDNPLKQNEIHCKEISKVIGKNYTVHSVIVMVNNNAGDIKCDNVINLCDLNKYIKNFDDDEYFDADEIDFIYNQLIKSKSHISHKKHVRNIKKTKKNLDIHICPRCGGDLEVRRGKNGILYVCSNYPKCKFIKKF